MPITIADLFSQMPGAFLPEKAQGLNAVIQFNFSGAEAGNWNVEIKNSTIKVEKGIHAAPSLTISADSADCLKLFNKEIDPMQAFLRGKLKVQGDMWLAMKMMQFFKTV